MIDIGFADPRDVPAWRAQADVLDGTVAGMSERGRFAIAGAVRQSWLDRAVDAVADPRELAPNAPVPRWTDGQVCAASYRRTSR